MPAYWISRANVTDADALAEYAKRAAPAIESQGGRYLARGGPSITPEGEAWERYVVIQFDSLEAAQACYNSPAYQAALEFAKKAVVRDVWMVEGV